MIITVPPYNVSSRLVAIAFLGALLSVSAIGQEIYDAGSLTDRALAQRAAGDYDQAIRSLRAAVAADPVPVRTQLFLAETLAWAKRFGEAEREYRAVLERDPTSHDANLGLARVLLWQGRYRDARAMFLQLRRKNDRDMDAAEGAATAAYWAGDYRVAQRELEAIVRQDPNRNTARQSLDEIAALERPVDRIGIDAVDDDQPYRTLRASTTTSIFSDPLTRWDASAGSWWLDASNPRVRANAPYVRIGNETIFPASRLAVTASVGAMRYPDGTTRPVGSAAVSFRTSGRSRLSAAVEQDEMLATATAIDRHIAARATALQWTRQAEHAWIAAIDARRIQYSDSNRGWALTGYGMKPVFSTPRVELSAGASFAVRDTNGSRFYVESVSSRRVENAFLYSYRGAYTPYWTPRGFREMRGIVAAEAPIRSANIRFQADAGITRDRGTNFGPDAGSSALPDVIVPFEFRRTYHPVRLQLTFRTPIARGLSLDTTVERSTTVFYTANAIRASLVRRR